MAALFRRHVAGRVGSPGLGKVPEATHKPGLPTRVVRSRAGMSVLRGGDGMRTVWRAAADHRCVLASV